MQDERFLRWGRLPLPAFVSPFVYPSFRRLWTGAFLSSVGTWTQDVALAWLIHTSFKDPMYLGLRTFAADAPLITFMLLGGAVADRVDRRRILLTSQVLQMSFASALGLLYAAGKLGIGPILLIAFCTGLAQSQSAPTYQAVLTSLVPPAQIPNAVALNSLQFNLSRAIGPAVAGLLLAQGGTGVCFAVNALSFLAVIIALLRVEMPVLKASEGSLRESLQAGFRHVAHTPLLALLTVLAALGSLLAFPLSTYLPAVATSSLGTGAGGYSALLSSLGLGAIVGAIATAQRGGAPGRGRLLLVYFIGYGLTTSAAALSRWQAASMALLFLSGLCMVSAFSMLNSLVQEITPPEMKGRVLGIYGFAFRGGMPLGSLLAGALARVWGAPVVIAGFSFTLAALSLGLLLRSHRLRAC